MPPCPFGNGMQVLPCGFWCWSLRKCVKMFEAVMCFVVLWEVFCVNVFPCRFGGPLSDAAAIAVAMAITAWSPRSPKRCQACRILGTSSEGIKSMQPGSKKKTWELWRLLLPCRLDPGDFFGDLWRLSTSSASAFGRAPGRSLGMAAWSPTCNHLELSQHNFWHFDGYSFPDFMSILIISPHDSTRTPSNFPCFAVAGRSGQSEWPLVVNSHWHRRSLGGLLVRAALWGKATTYREHAMATAIMAILQRFLRVFVSGQAMGIWWSRFLYSRFSLDEKGAKCALFVECLGQCRRL